MAVEGTFQPYPDVRSNRVERIFSKLAVSPREVDRAKKGKSAKFRSEDLSIAALSSQLGKIGRIVSYNVTV